MQGGSVIFVRRSIERVVRNLPTLPAAVARVVEEADRPDPSAARMEQFIHRDPALTAQVLRVVNSAYYGLSGQVSNVGQAIVILGVQQVRNLALSVGAIGTLTGRSPADVENAKRFWRHAAAVSAGIEVLSDRIPMTSAEYDALRVAALIHDLGRLCVMTSFGELYDMVVNSAEEERIPVEVAELRVLGMNHAEVGRQIAEHWKLPPLLVDMIGRHEGPFLANDADALYALNAADTLSKACYFVERDLETPEISPVVLSRLGLDADGVLALAQAMEERASDAEHGFGMAAA
ncbi:MAG: HDOD domain-containing protein [Fimbriimonas sp.]